MADKQALARAARMLEARLRYGAKLKKKITQTQMAAAVAEVLGAPLSQSTWSDYELAISEPPLDVIDATARVSELSPAYIAWGVTPSDEEPTSTPPGEDKRKQA